MDPYKLNREIGRLAVLATGRIDEAMERRGLSRADLARKLGVSPAHVTQVLDGERNMTLRTLVSFGAACGIRWDIAPAHPAAEVWGTLGSETWSSEIVFEEPAPAEVAGAAPPHLATSMLSYLALPSLN